MGTNPGRADLTYKRALTEGTWYPSLPPASPRPLNSLQCLLPHPITPQLTDLTSAPTGRRKLLPLGHWMLLKVLFILVSTPFSAGSPDLFVCSLAAFSLSLMLLNHGPKYPLVQQVFIKHLQCIIHFPGYQQQDHCPNSCGNETFSDSDPFLSDFP